METSSSITSDNLKPIWKAFEAMDSVKKNMTNEFFKDKRGEPSKYANLEAVIEAVSEPLKANGVVMTQEIYSNEQGMDFIKTRFIEIKSGEWIEFGPLRIPAKDSSNPQSVKSGITMMRRTQILTACGMAEADDDGNTAAQNLSASIPPKANPYPTAKPMNYAPGSGGKALSEAQVYRAYKIGKVHGFSNQDVDKTAQEKYSKPVKELNKQQYDEFTNFLEASGPPQDLDVPF